ncbi:MFS transporter [Dictyobacter aurantiacus]|uniref:MFS transporter n=1 Tax=Dictyobacter aurantiacus TaxID=1936993 RepID=A0A401ZSA1_9CHLR|nr:MFS transporter [Dictyobacter aurantiacus]GCE09788.1 MFS transporter [Dictyobacter aurantiacus]
MSLKDVHSLSSVPPTPKRRWYYRWGELWENGDFLKFWLGESVSLFGSQVTLVAIPLAAILVLQVTPQQLGLLRTFEWLPYIPLPLLLGVWVDRRRRRPLMIVANLLRTCLIALVPLLAALHLLQITLLYAIVFSVGTCTVLFDLCWQSYVPLLVRKKYLVEANSKIAASMAAAEVGGPGLAGVLIQILSAPAALLVDSLSYLVSILSLCLIKQRETRPERELQLSWYREVVEGVRFAVHNPYIRTLAFQAAAWNFCFAILDTIFLLYAIRELAFSPGLLGLIYAIGSVGGLLGPVLATTLMKRFHLGWFISGTFTLGSTPFIFLSLFIAPHLLVVAVCLAVFFLVHIALGIYTVVSISLRQAVTAHNMMGRVSASLRVVTYGATSLGALTSGFIGAMVGLRMSIFLAGCGFIVALLPIFFSPVIRLRSMPDPKATM